MKSDEWLVRVKFYGVPPSVAADGLAIELGLCNGQGQSVIPPAEKRRFWALACEVGGRPVPLVKDARGARWRGRVDAAALRGDVDVVARVGGADVPLRAFDVLPAALEVRGGRVAAVRDVAAGGLEPIRVAESARLVSNNELVLAAYLADVKRFAAGSVVVDVGGCGALAAVAAALGAGAAVVAGDDEAALAEARARLKLKTARVVLGDRPGGDVCGATAALVADALAGGAGAVPGLCFTLSCLEKLEEVYVGHTRTADSPVALQALADTLAARGFSDVAVCARCATTGGSDHAALRFARPRRRTSVDEPGDGRVFPAPIDGFALC